MKIRLGEGIRMAGPAGAFGPGDVVEMDTTTARILISKGAATAVDAPEVPTKAVETVAPPVEYAAVTAPQVATGGSQRKRGKGDFERQVPRWPNTEASQGGGEADDATTD